MLVIDTDSVREYSGGHPVRIVREEPPVQPTGANDGVRLMVKCQADDVSGCTLLDLRDLMELVRAEMPQVWAELSECDCEAEKTDE